MGKIIRITESHLRNVISRIIEEQSYDHGDYDAPQFKNKSEWDDNKQYRTLKPPNKDWGLPSPTKQDAIMQVQDSLNLAGLNVIVDGVFGDKTKRAVGQYQKTNGLKVTGVVDSATAHTMGLSDIIGKFLPLFSSNTFNRPSVRPSASQQNVGDNENTQPNKWGANLQEGNKKPPVKK